MFRNLSIWGLCVFLAAHRQFKRPAPEAHDLDQKPRFRRRRTDGAQACRPGALISGNLFPASQFDGDQSAQFHGA